MPFPYIGSQKQSHVKQLLCNCCKANLSRSVSHKFCFVGNAVTFSPEGEDSMFLWNVGINL